MYKILVVEDEEPIANLIAMSLGKCGYQCETIYNGQEAADCMQERTYDLGIFDIMLPGLDGYELLQYAKAIQMPVLFLTAKDETMDKVKGLKLGADDYMTKPFELVELQARVENVLRHYHKEQQHYQIREIQIDVPSRIVTKDEKLIELTYKELVRMVNRYNNTAA